ncbi:MAG: exopolysaccharide biosynthesis polyprenyl glycosylphosphotransferase [Solobacterium sp.]|nr:exopolysaccharide biosynthesis polyprenyl glycosylphosphotransferase [Solobacterium sp.]
MNSIREKEKQSRKLWIGALQLLNVILITAVFSVGWLKYYWRLLSTPYFQKGIAVLILIFALLYIVLCITYSGFKIDTPRKLEIAYSQMLAEVFSDFVMYFVTFLLMKTFPPVLPILGIFVIQVMMTCLWTLLAHKLYFSLVKPAKAVVVWDTRKSLEDLVESYGLNIRFEIVRTLHISECQENLADILKDIEVVFLCGIHSHERNQIAKYCVEHDLSLYVIPRIGDVIMSNAKPVHMFHLPMLYLERYNPSIIYFFVKRVFDIVSSGLGLLILSPLLLVVGLLIKRDGGPAFYKQTRLTKNGRQFQIIKFRSMRVDAEKDGVARLSTGENDDRITPIGKFIRACRIDELPQLINIFKGEMSVVGPRPERPEIAAEYEKVMPEFALRLQTKAGLTGLAQVFGKYNTTPYDKLLMDLQYIASASVFEDLRIILATVKILFVPESTEGVEEGSLTAMEKDVQDRK